MKSARIAFKEGCSSMYCLCDSCSSSWNWRVSKIQEPGLIPRSNLKNIEHKRRAWEWGYWKFVPRQQSPSYPGIWRPFLDLLPMEDNQEGTLWLSSDRPFPGMPSPLSPHTVIFSLFLRQLHDIAHACDIWWQAYRAGPRIMCAVQCRTCMVIWQSVIVTCLEVRMFFLSLQHYSQLAGNSHLAGR